MTITLNEDIAGRLDEVGYLLAEQRANLYYERVLSRGGLRPRTIGGRPINAKAS